MISPKSSEIFRTYRFPIILIIAIIIGSIVGLIMGEKAVVFKPFGDIFINLMFTIVVPLVFFTISSAISKMADLKRLGRIMGNILLVFVITGLIASVIMIFVVTAFPPTQGVDIKLETMEIGEELNMGDQIVKGLTVSDFPGLLSRKNMLPLIVFSILLGVSVTLLGKKGETISNFLELMSDLFMKVVKIVMYYAPIGIGAYFAALVAKLGPQLLSSYGRALLVYYPVCILYFVFAFTGYAFYAGGSIGVKRFWKNIITPAVTSLATQSSVATIPVNLEAAERIGTSKDIREIVLPIGATMHMDGSCLSAILKIAFLFGIFNVPFHGIGVFTGAIVISIFSGVAMSGVPGGGFIGEMLVISLYGFPPEAFPIIATIGILVDAPATLINATGDTVVAMMITRMVEGKEKVMEIFKEAKEKFEVA